MYYRKKENKEKKENKKKSPLEKKYDSCTPIQKIHLDMTLNNSRRKNPHGNRFTEAQKNFSAAKFSRCPQAYREDRKNTILPSESLCKKQLRLFDIRTGINEDIKNRLAEARQKMEDPKEAVVSLMWDEMKIRPFLDYSITEDCIIGFERFGSTLRSKKIADHALVPMLRGINSGWKIPIAYGFCDGTTAAEDLRKIVEESAKMCEEAGYVISATVCDQGATNRSTIKSFQDLTELIRKRGQQPGLEKCKYRKSINLITQKKIFNLLIK